MITHLPIEPYKQRYTEFLAQWEADVFKREFVEGYKQVSPLPDSANPVVLDVVAGSVLDAVARPSWSMAQMGELIRSPGKSHIGHVYFSDFYTTGLDALPYSGRGFKAHAFLWAQTFDQYDFTAKTMMSWMRPWELMAFDIYTNVFVASTLLRDLIVTAFPHVAHKVHAVGLPFNSLHVASQLDPQYVRGSLEYDVVYTSRWDTEKNPGFFLSLVESRPDLKFAVCTGWPTVRGNDYAAISRLNSMVNRVSNLTVHTGLLKPQYYAILSGCKVQFNCALQDWVSFTLLEALTFGCAPLYPNFRSFPEALEFQQDFLYVPHNLADANRKLNSLLASGARASDSILHFHDGTLNRIADIIKATK